MLEIWSQEEAAYVHCQVALNLRLPILHLQSDVCGEMGGFQGTIQSAVVAVTEPFLL